MPKSDLVNIQDDDNDEESEWEVDSIEFERNSFDFIFIAGWWMNYYNKNSIAFDFWKNDSLSSYVNILVFFSIESL